MENLGKSFSVAGVDGAREELLAVDDVSFAIAPGESLAIVGESGSGKTTVARMIAGLETPSTGTVAFDGVARPLGRASRAERRRRARQVQMVFQDPYGSLDPRQTVRASISEVLKEHFPGDPAARVDELLAQVGVDERQASARPSALSGGQRQRVAIARALAVQPRLLILDEAVSALDVSVQAQVINVLVDLRRNLDVAFLFVSHDLAVVRQVSDRCVVMRAGRVLESGPTGDVLDHPTHPYTRRLLEAIPRPGWSPRQHAALGADIMEVPAP